MKKWFIIGISDSEELTNTSEQWEIKINNEKEEEKNVETKTIQALNISESELNRYKGEEAWETKIDPEDIIKIDPKKEVSSINTSKKKSFFSYFFS